MGKGVYKAAGKRNRQHFNGGRTEWVDGLGYTEAMIEFENYWEEYFTDTIQEVIEGQI